MTGSNPEQAAYWESRAPSWLEAGERIDLVSGRFGVAALDRLGAQPGERLLDVGCGSGGTTIELAGRATPGGSAVGADIAPSMVVAARERAEKAGIDNVDFVVADMQDADLGAGVFDAVFSKFGVMFFADPVAAFNNLRNALRPGGRMAFVCWQDLLSNEWMFVPGSAVVSVTGQLPPMPEPGAPGPFSFAEPERVESVLGAAGFDDVEIEPLSETITMPESDLDSMVELTTRAGAVHEALREADDDTRSRVIAAVRAALGERVEDGELRLKAAALLVTGHT